MKNTLPAKILIVDANAICYSAFYSMGYLSTKAGMSSGIIYGFFSQIEHVCRSLRIGHIVFCWDSRKSLRKKLDPVYKSNRRKEKIDDALLEGFSQFDEIRDQILPALGFVNSFRCTGFEADDLIASLCLFPGPAEDQHYFIMSNDNDLYQLLTQNVSMYLPGKKIVYSKWDFIEEYKIDPLLWASVKAMAGCPGDNVIGIPSIGVVRACQYIMEYAGSRNHKVIDTIESKRIIAHNKPLVTLPFAGTPKFELDWETLPSYAAWIEICEKYEFESFLRRPDTFEHIFSGLVPSDGMDKVKLGGRCPKALI